MKSLAWIVALTCLPVRLAWAQVSVELAMDDDRLVAGEAVVVGVKITNLSGQTLTFGRAPDWVTFVVEAPDRKGVIVPRLADVDAAGEFSVGSAQVATRRIDLAPAFQLTVPGHYLVTAAVKIPEWSKELASAALKFEITPGMKLWEQEFGVPTATDCDSPPEVRKYALVQAKTLSSAKLCVRLTDRYESKIFRVLTLGPTLSVSQPERQLDKHNNLHVLWQTGPRVFTYCVVTPGAELALRQSYQYTLTRPVLKLDLDGQVGVVGGMRRAADTDFPPAAPAGRVTGDHAKPNTP